MTPTFLELITTDRHAGTDPGAPGDRIEPSDFDYAYDHIGDRKSVTLDAAAPIHYCVNPLNQYDQTRATTAHSSARQCMPCLPAKDEPSFWKDPPIEGPAYRSATSSWDCCGWSDAYNQLFYHPE